MTADDIINAWIADDSGEMDLCKYCIHDAEHLVGAACTGFVWNGKELDERFGV